MRILGEFGELGGYPKPLERFARRGFGLPPTQDDAARGDGAGGALARARGAGERGRRRREGAARVASHAARDRQLRPVVPEPPGDAARAWARVHAGARPGSGAGERGARRVRGHLPRGYLDRAKEDIRHGKEEEAPSRGTGRSRYARDVATAFAADRLNVR